MTKQIMQLCVVAALGLGVSQAALADEITGAYVQGDVGLSYMKADTVEHSSVRNALKSSYDESKFMPRVSVGYDYGDWRVAGDYTHYSELKDGNGAGNVSTKVRGAGVSAMYDFPVQFSVPVQPYVGARLGVNKVKRTANTAGVSVSESETKVSPGLLAGVGYKWDNHVTVDAGYRYNHLDSDVKVHEASVGVRYTF